MQTHPTTPSLTSPPHPPPPPQFDAACFDGHYVTGDVDAPYLAALEASGRGSGRRSGVTAKGDGAEANGKLAGASAAAA
jgi:hypothetical protein